MSSSSEYRIIPIAFQNVSGTMGGLLKKNKQTAVCFSLQFPGFGEQPRFFDNPLFQVDVTKNKYVAMQGIKTSKKIERRLARFSLKVHFQRIPHYSNCLPKRQRYNGTPDYINRILNFGKLIPIVPRLVDVRGTDSRIVKARQYTIFTAL